MSTVTLMKCVTVDVDVDLEDALEDLSHEQLVRLRAAIDSRLGLDAPCDVEQIFNACRSGDRERAFDLAYSYSRDILGRVC